MKILLIEDNVQLSSNIIRYLSLSDITCIAALDGEKGLHLAKTWDFDVIILDLHLPKLSGKEVLQTFLREGKSTPFLILTSDSLRQDIIDGLNLWADDYMTKPFDLDELLARLHALYRRNLKNKSNILTFWKYVLDLDQTVLLKGKEKISLSHLEFKLLTYLAQNQGKTLSRQELYQKVWGEFDGDIMFSKTIDVYIGYLRKKLEKDLIETVKWIGYKLI